MHDLLGAWLGESTPFRAPIQSIARIGTGHSRAMLRVVLADGTRLVVRMEQGGVFGTSGTEEARIMSSLRAAGVPVAEIVATETVGAVTGQPFFVMAHVDGDPSVDERHLDPDTAVSFVDTLHHMHQLDGRSFGFELVPPTPTDATPMQVERWRDVYRSACVAPIPLLEEAAAWLTVHAPPLDRLAVVHGDAGPGNFVHAGGRVVALTDFEFTHLGDPDEDWGFCIAMRGARTMSREAWVALIADRTGRALTPEVLRYWEAFNLFKGACANRTCLDLFERGVNRAPNMAIIGTALHQVFLRRLVDLVEA